MTTCNGTQCEVHPAEATTASLRKPRYDVAEFEGGFYVYVELPGVAATDVSVTEREGMLIVEGKRGERGYELRLRLARDLAGGPIDAQYAHGLLTLKLEKNEAAKPRKVPVSVQ